jgi:hypothetical protein
MLNDAENYLIKDTKVFLDCVPDLPTRFGLSNVCRVFSVHPGFAVLQVMLEQDSMIPGYVINANTSDIEWNKVDKRWELSFNRVRIPK